MAPRSSDRNTNHAKILLVDDNRNGLIARKSVLEELGYVTVATTDPAEALDLFSKQQFDLVITDYKMPSVDGLEVIQRIRALNENVPIILISGFVENLGMTEASTGADAVVQKCANEIQHLVRAVSRLTRRKPVRKSAGRAAPLKAKAKGVS